MEDIGLVAMVAAAANAVVIVVQVLLLAEVASAESLRGAACTPY